MFNKTKTEIMEEVELKKACALVERHCRSLGKDCTVIFTLNGVSIAPQEWAADSFGETLFEALEEAESNH